MKSLKAVIDTNVVVSGILQLYGNPGKIMQMVLDNEILVYYDARILAEYEDVLSRPKFDFTDKESRVKAILDEIKTNGCLVSSCPLTYKLPGPDDLKFIEVAVAGTVPYIVTGNTKHFPNKKYRTVKVVTPKQFLKEKK